MANLVLVLTTLFLLLSCGVGQDVVLNEGKTQGPTVEIPGPGDGGGEQTGGGDTSVFLNGIYKTSEGEEKQLSDLKEKPTVIIFAGQFCSVCQEEHEHFVSSLKNPSKAPVKVNLVTLMVGAAGKPAIAKFFKQDFSIPWEVGVDRKNNDLYKTYCQSSISTPCLIIQTPEKGLTFKHIGETALVDIQAITGPWED